MSYISKTMIDLDEQMLKGEEMTNIKAIPASVGSLWKRPLIRTLLSIGAATGDAPLNTRSFVPL